jgi:hypothetical protein
MPQMWEVECPRAFHHGMDSDNITDEEVYRFILLQIDTVPHLEALLILWRKRPQAFSEQELAGQLFVDTGTVRQITKDLARADLINISSSSPPRYSYEPKFERSEALMDALASLYRRDLVNISKLIHSKAPSAARDFARAFKFTKDRD